MNPMPTQNWYNSFYASEFWEEKSKKNANSKEQINIKKMWKKELAWADKFISLLDKHKVRDEQYKRILEIGCAYGVIVKAIAGYFKGEGFGVEPSHAARDSATKYANVNIVAENMDQLSNWDPEKEMDMIICSHVIENIVDLDLVFSTVRRLLVPKGLFLIDTPNVFFQKSISIYHPYCFCEKSLFTLLLKYGFKIIDTKKSGRAKKVLTPRFLTMLAKKEKKTDETHLNGIDEDYLFEFKLILAKLWRKFTNVSPINMVDQILTSTCYPPSSYNVETLAKLKKDLTENTNKTQGAEGRDS